MSGRHNRPEPRTNTAAKRGALAAGVGVAGLAALAAAPLVDGSPVGAATVPTATVTDSPSTTEASTTTSTTSAPETTTTTATTTTTTTTTTSAPETSATTTTDVPDTETSTTAGPTSEPIRTTTTSAVPQYGLQKYRIGVERDPDPAREIPGTINTVTSEAHVVETSPGGEVTRDFTCVTAAGTPDDATDATFCPGEQISLRQARGVQAARGHLDPTPGLPLNAYYAAPGSTVTVTQTKVVDGLVIDAQTLTLAPCESSFGQCVDGEGEGFSFKSTDMIFTDTALPPKAIDDKATTEQNTPVTIDVAANDFSYGSNDTYSATVTGIDIAEQPKHGTVTVASSGGSADVSSDDAEAAQTMRIAAGAPTLTYTPNNGFSGTDPFRYTLSTKNGASTATVTVTVPGATTTTPDAPDTTEPGSLGVDPESETRAPDGTGSDNDSDLAATGSAPAPLAGYGLALLGAGAGAVAVGRHRHGGRRGGRRPRRAH